MRMVAAIAVAACVSMLALLDAGAANAVEINGCSPRTRNRAGALPA